MASAQDFEPRVINIENGSVKAEADMSGAQRKSGAWKKVPEEDVERVVNMTREQRLAYVKVG